MKRSKRNDEMMNEHFKKFPSDQLLAPQGEAELNYDGITPEMVEAGCAAVMAAHVYCDDPERLVKSVFSIMRDSA